MPRPCPARPATLRGGELPTVTDCDVVLGYIDPNYFLGGRIKLDAGRAAAAVEAKVARPLGMDLYGAAWGVKEVVDGLMGQEIYRIAAMTSGLDPREFMIFAFGGAGPVHASGYAEAADVSRIAAFPFSSVAGAFGTLSLDLLQSYERTYSAMVSSHDLRIIDKIIPDLNAAIAELVTLGQRDMDEEGFAMGRIAFQLEVSMRFGQQRHSLPVPAPQLAFRDADDLRFLVDRFVDQYREAYGAEAVFIEAGVEIWVSGSTPWPGWTSRHFPASPRRRGKPYAKALGWPIGARGTAPSTHRSTTARGSSLAPRCLARSWSRRPTLSS